MVRLQLMLIFFVGTLTIISASDAVKDNSEADMASEDDSSPSVGFLDIVVLAALAIGALYWFFGRKKEDDSAASTYVIQTTNVLQRQQSINKGFIAKMKNKIQDIVPLEVTNVTVSSNKETNSKMQSNKGTRQRQQSVPVISVISGNINDEILQDDYLQGT